MTIYKAPLDDQRFALFDVLGAEAVLAEREERSVDLEICRLHVAATNGADRVDRAGVAIIRVRDVRRVLARVVQHLLAVLHADGGAQRPTRKRKQILREGAVELDVGLGHHM